MSKLEQIKIFNRIVASVDFSINEVNFFGVTGIEDSWRYLFTTKLDEHLASTLVSLVQQDCCIENSVVPGFWMLEFNNKLVVTRMVFRQLWIEAAPAIEEPGYDREIIEFYQRQVEEGNLDAERDTADRFPIIRFGQEEYLKFRRAIAHLNLSPRSNQ